MPEQPVILITGASSGIGAATARLFAQKGYRLALAARRFERLQALAEEIEAQGGQALPITADLGRLEDIQNMATATLERFGQVDVLFNNAGFGRLNWLENLEASKDIEAQVQVNVLGVIWTTQALLPHMIACRRGHIINMASIAGLIGTPTYSVYDATKFAVRGFGEGLRREVGVYGLRVSTICPGGVETEFGEAAGFHRTTRVTTPRPLVLSAEQVAQAVWGLVRRPRRLLVIPGIMLPAVWLNALVPGLLDGAIQRLFVRRERARS
ncbi:MAG: SDR family oxidoreductase [Chloroflexota bacterium]